MLPVLGRYTLRMSVVAAALIYAAVNDEIVLWVTIPFIFASQVAMTLGEVFTQEEKEAS
jgi:hypothetical protein